jgi:NAD+ synthase (glutamine-hydrolysing)
MARKKADPDYGFFRTAVAVPVVSLGDPEANAEEIIRLAKDAAKENTQFVVFPELSLTGYTCEDLFLRNSLIAAAMVGLKKILTATAKLDVILAVGLPLEVNGMLFNTAMILRKGKILAVIPKTYLPNYGEFYDRRWFASASQLSAKEIRLFGQLAPIGTDILIDVKNIPNCRIGAEICEDGWMAIPPSAYHALNGATVIANLSASDELVAKADYRRALFGVRSADLIAAYLYAGAGWGESSKDLVFGGHAMIYENSYLLAESKRFQPHSQLIIADLDLDALAFDRRRSNSRAENAAHHRRDYRLVTTLARPLSFSRKTAKLCRRVNAEPFVPSDPRTLAERCEEIINIQTAGLAMRLKHLEPIIKRQVSIGISGGLDSTLALLVVVRAFDLLGWPREGILAATMPGFGTGERTHSNAYKLCEALGVPLREISIVRSSEVALRDLGHEPCGNCLVCENVQARIRTINLMALGFMINTGDLSEIAQGWCTFAGDQTGMYAVNAGVPKTLVRFLIRHLVVAKSLGEAAEDVLIDILDTPISPELTRTEQKTEDLIGPYELHDFTLYHWLRWGAGPKRIFFLAQMAFGEKYEARIIVYWLNRFFQRFFASQFKRDANPDGIKVGSVCLSQRGDWRMPSDFNGSFVFREIEEILAALNE